VIVLDTSGLLAALDGSEPHHAAAVAALRRASAPRLLSPFVLAELDYLLAERVNARAARALLGEVSGGSYQLEPFDAVDVARAAAVVDRYADLRLGIADASIVVIAARHGTLDVLTLDERHFRAIRDDRGRAFCLLPGDAP
jgi:predicted nucleic acid-binding protein